MTLILLSGLPGSGKSTVAQEICNLFADSIVHYQNDAIRKELFPTPTYEMTETLHVLDRIHTLARESLLSGKTVLIDGIYWKESERIEIKDLARVSWSSFLLLHIIADEETTKTRLSQRTNTLSDANFEVYQKLKPLFEPIQIDHFTLQNNGSVEELREKIGWVLQGKTSSIL